MEHDEMASSQEPAKLRDLFREFAGAVVPVFVLDQNGDEGVGTAFHVGEGIFVTARHVVEGKRSARVELDPGGLPASVTKGRYFDQLIWPISPGYHHDPRADVAVFQIEELSVLPVVRLGSHLDDWINDEQFILNEVLVMGFPPIPLANRPLLLAARGEVNAVVDLVGGQHVHFILSATARGGFSGGVVLSEWNFALGLVTQSLVKDSLPEEFGYLTVLSVEPIYQCMADNDLMPAQVSDLFPGLFTKQSPLTN